MKYFIFMLVFAGGIPAIAFAASQSAKLRSACYAILMFIPAMGDMSGINFFSVETYRGPDGGLELTLAEMFALGLLLSRQLGSHTDRRRPKKSAPGFMLLVAYAAIGAAGLSGALQPFFGMFTVIKFLRITMVYSILWSSATSEKDPSVFYTGVRRGLTAGLLYVGYMALSQKFIQHYYRVKGPFDHSNTIPLFVNPAAPTILVWALGDRRIGKIEFLLMMGAVGAGLIAVVATQSRLGMMLALAALAAAFFIATRLELSGRAKATVLVFVILAAIGGSMVAKTIIDRFLNAPESSEQAREEFKIAAKMMARDKVLGVGLNNFSETMTLVEKYNAHVEVMANEESAGVVHNIYWLSAAETGFIGMGVIILLYITVWWSVAKPGILVQRGLKRNLPEAVALAAGVGQIALHMSGFFEWAFRITPVICQYLYIAACMSAIGRLEGMGVKPFGDEKQRGAT
jgi:O-antigen ligase